MRYYRSLLDVKIANGLTGQNWFAFGSLALYHTLIFPTIHFGRFFIASDEINREIRFSIYECDASGWIKPFGLFRQHPSLQFAAQAIAKEVRYESLPLYRRHRNYQLRTL